MSLNRGLCKIYTDDAIKGGEQIDPSHALDFRQTKSINIVSMYPTTVFPSRYIFLLLVRRAKNQALSLFVYFGEFFFNFLPTNVHRLYLSRSIPFVEHYIYIQTDLFSTYSIL